MGVARPRVSVGLLVFNGENYLAQAVDSLLAQTYVDFELILSDNASTDATEKICRDFAARDDRVRYVRQPRNIGVAKNFNQTFATSRGELFKCSAHDDLYAPTFLHRCVEVLDSDPGAVLAHCAAAFIGPGGDPLPRVPGTGAYRDPRGKAIWPELACLAESNSAPERFSEILLAMQWCFPIFGVIRADALRATALHRTFYGADKTLLAELALLGRFRQIDEPLYRKRVHLEMSVYLDDGEKRQHIDPRAPQRFATLQRAAAYIAAIQRAPLDARERYRCLGSVARKLGEHLWLRMRRLRRRGEQIIPGQSRPP